MRSSNLVNTTQSFFTICMMPNENRQNMYYKHLLVGHKYWYPICFPCVFHLKWKKWQMNYVNQIFLLSKLFMAGYKSFRAGCLGVWGIHWNVDWWIKSSVRSAILSHSSNGCLKKLYTEGCAKKNTRNELNFNTFLIRLSFWHKKQMSHLKLSKCHAWRILDWMVLK